MTGIDIRGTKIIDLSQAIEPGIPIPPGQPAPRLEAIISQERGDVVNVELISLGVHTATHVDAPFHFFSELRRIHELPADCLIGPAVVVDMTGRRGSVPIEAEHFRSWALATGEAIRPGDIVLLHTGHSQNWGVGEAAPAYWENGWPYLARSAVKYLASIPIRALGVETLDPDRVNAADMSPTEFTTHRTFLPEGILILENLTNLDRIPGTRCPFIALPLKIKGASGSPVRAVAIV